MATAIQLVLGAIGGVTQFIDELEKLSTQAFRLALRIRGLEEPLLRIQRSERSYPEEALHQLLNAVQDSHVFLETFRQATSLWRIRSRHSSGRTLSELNCRIADVVQTLEFGLAVKSWEGEDELDRAHDREMLLEELEEMQVTQSHNHEEVMQAITVRRV